MEETSLVLQNQQIATKDTWLDASIVVHQITEIQKIHRSIMKEGIHYGAAFPGSDKPSLLQPGAELLGLIFRISSEPNIEIKDLGNNHREYIVRLRATNSVNGQFLGSGVGSCSTMESKYRYRKASLKCPKCGKETIIKGKEQYDGGWLCWKRNGGCGSKWPDGAAEIEKQPLGKIENPDIADQWNTVLKMAKKRAYVDLIKSVTGASAFFTQDAEDFIDAKFEDITPPVVTKTYDSDIHQEPPTKPAPPPMTPEDAQAIKDEINRLLLYCDPQTKAGFDASTKPDKWSQKTVDFLKTKVRLTPDEIATITDVLSRQPENKLGQFDAAVKAGNWLEAIRLSEEGVAVELEKQTKADLQRDN